MPSLFPHSKRTNHCLSVGEAQDSQTEGLQSPSFTSKKLHQSFTSKRCSVFLFYKSFHAQGKPDEDSKIIDKPLPRQG